MCGTGLPAGLCCWTPSGYFKKPQVIDLHNTGVTGRRDGCYMQATNACDTTLSAEHPISQSVLKVLAEKQVEVSGVPWLKGETKVLGFGALRARCLCARHNSLLSPIDMVGAKFFEAIQRCGTTEGSQSLPIHLENVLCRCLAPCHISANDGHRMGTN
jgi:hypothetical protein